MNFIDGQESSDWRFFNVEKLKVGDILVFNSILSPVEERACVVLSEFICIGKGGWRGIPTESASVTVRGGVFCLKTKRKTFLVFEFFMQGIPNWQAYFPDPGIPKRLQQSYWLVNKESLVEPK